MGVSKNSGKTLKMDGLFHGKPYEQMDDLGDFTTPIFGNTHILSGKFTQKKIWTILGASYHRSFEIPIKKQSVNVHTCGFDPMLLLK